MWWSEHKEWCHPRDGDKQVMVTLDEGNNSDSQGWDTASRLFRIKVTLCHSVTRVTVTPEDSDTQ